MYSSFFCLRFNFSSILNVFKFCLYYVKIVSCMFIDDGSDGVFFFWFKEFFLELIVLKFF